MARKCHYFQEIEDFYYRRVEYVLHKFLGSIPCMPSQGKKQQRITLRVWNRNKSHEKLSILFFILAHCVWALDVGPTFFLPSLWFSSFLLLKFMSVWAYLWCYPQWLTSNVQFLVYISHPWISCDKKNLLIMIYSNNIGRRPQQGRAPFEFVWLFFTF